MKQQQLPLDGEHINRFFQLHETVVNWLESAYLAQFPDLSSDEVIALLRECRAIERAIFAAANQFAQTLPDEDINSAFPLIAAELHRLIEAQYPYLAEQRRAYLVSMALYCLLR